MPVVLSGAEWRTMKRGGIRVYLGVRTDTGRCEVLGNGVR